MENLKRESSLNDIFYENLVKQIRSIDSYGSYAKHTDKDLVELRFIKKDGAENLKPEQMTLSIKIYLQTLSVALERICGHIISLMTETGCDGSVKAIFYCGQLIILDKTFGGINGLQYNSLEKLNESGEKLLNRMQNIMNEKLSKYSELMG